MKIQKSIEIASGAEKIWPFLVEPVNVMKWCRDLEKILTGGHPGGIGALFYFEERAVGRLLKLHFVVTEWEVNRSFAFKMTSGDIVKGYEQRYTLEPLPWGTRLTCFEHVVFPLGIMGRVAGLLRKPVSEARLQRMLVNLKGLGEG